MHVKRDFVLGEAERIATGRQVVVLEDLTLTKLAGVVWNGHISNVGA
jgi:hypothetical protein